MNLVIIMSGGRSSLIQRQDSVHIDTERNLEMSFSPGPTSECPNSTIERGKIMAVSRITGRSILTFSIVSGIPLRGTPDTMLNVL